jgi:DNA-binding response OmpR family regulator
MPAVAGVSTLVALQRNRRPADRRVAQLRAADLEIDALRRRIRQGTREVQLSPVEHILLYTLAARPGAVLSYRELAEALGSTDVEVRNNTLARHISSLRRKLRDDADRPRYVETVVGVGYRFVTALKT